MSCYPLLTRSFKVSLPFPAGFGRPWASTLVEPCYPPCLGGGAQTPRLPTFRAIASCAGGQAVPFGIPSLRWSYYITGRAPCQEVFLGICWLVSGILPCPDCILGATDSNGSPHEGLGGRAVEARLPSQIPALCPSLDFHQRDGQGFVADFISDHVPIPEEERLGEARGEGDPKHLPGLRGYQPPFCDYILPHPRLYVNPFLKNF